MKPLMAVALLPPFLYGQVSGGGGYDVGSALASLGIGALVAAPFVVAWRSAQKRVEHLETRQEELTNRQLEREQKLSQEMYPVLVDAARTIAAVQQGMTSAALQPSREIDVMVSKLEQLLAALNKGASSG